ncbi:hypothetical protein L484_002139 [Morus notabilis]|uniref:Uncharacterized protein n=1 Tax=Morus notabilis TaxID=981085 RepID=W9S7H3_9ROSA|nr:hypothetical protein L484_002139 [Morus notabilis]
MSFLEVLRNLRSSSRPIFRNYPKFIFGIVCVHLDHFQICFKFGQPVFVSEVLLSCPWRKVDDDFKSIFLLHKMTSRSPSTCNLFLPPSTGLLVSFDRSLELCRLFLDVLARKKVLRTALSRSSFVVLYESALSDHVGIAANQEAIMFATPTRRTYQSSGL